MKHDLDLWLRVSLHNIKVNCRLLHKNIELCYVLMQCDEKLHLIFHNLLFPQHNK